MLNRSKSAPVLKLGPVTITQGQQSLSRMAILLWGPSGVGKSTFAATAPGNKLWLSFGDNEHVSVAHRSDVMVADFSGLDHGEVCRLGQSPNPFGLDDLLRANENIATVVVDNATALTYKALQQSVSKGIGGSVGFRPSMEFPGISAYGGRNGIVLEMLTEILKVTARYQVHCIITAHEDDPTYIKDGKLEVIDYIGMSLGGKILNNTAWRLSEIWFMGQEGTSEKKRFLAFRATRKRKPMKTRMFTDKGLPEFFVDYDADLPDKGQMTIESFYKTWVDNGGRKIQLPKGKKK